MRSVLALATIAFTASAAATPWGVWGTKRTTSNCMSDDAASKVANNFRTLIASYSDDFADQTLTTDFVDYSDSVIELINGACTVDQNIPVSVSRPRISLAFLQSAAALHDCVHEGIADLSLPCSSALQSSTPATRSSLARVDSPLFPSRS
jgi:hypothetical protein